MSRLWKSLVFASLVLNAVGLLYVYGIIHPNPFGQQYYETEQLKMEVRQLKDELGATNTELGKVRDAVIRLHADVVVRK